MAPMPLDPSHVSQARMALGQLMHFEASQMGVDVTRQDRQETRMVIGFVTRVTL